jgi:hypothetical protein
VQKDRDAGALAVLEEQAELPREGGDTVPTPLVAVTDQLMFRKMKTDIDPQDPARPHRPSRFVVHESSL